MKLFLDDERHPVTDDWVVARTVEEAVEAIKTHGFPEEMSLDHDLGGDATGMQFLHRLVDDHIRGVVSIRDIKFNVHSQNPVGKRNMESLWRFVIRNLVEDENEKV